MRCVRVGGVSERPWHWSGINTIYINESGLYDLIFRSNKPEARLFKRWITFTVLPSLRKTGEYCIVEDDSDLIPQLTNPTGERKLHYKIIDHIRNKYENVVIIPGLGENQSTEFKKRDSKLKGYTAGQPDVILLSKYGNCTDVVCLELKCPGYEIALPKKQKMFHEQLEKNNVFTLVSNCYDDIIIFLHEHYQNLAEKPNNTLALPPPTEQIIDFSTNTNAKYWFNKLQSKQKILDQYSNRNIDHNTIPWSMSNIQLIEALIKLDQKTRH